MRPIKLPEPPSSPRGVPEIFDGGVFGVIRRAVIIGNGFPGAENQCIGLVRALGFSHNQFLYSIKSVHNKPGIRAMVNHTRRIDRLEGEIRAVPYLFNSEMEKIRSELTSTTQNLQSAVHTLAQSYGTLATEMSNLKRNAEKLSEKLTNPYFSNPVIKPVFINPFIPNQPNSLPHNNPQIIPTPVPFTINHEANDVEGRDLGKSEDPLTDRGEKIEYKERIGKLRRCMSKRRPENTAKQKKKVGKITNNRKHRRMEKSRPETGEAIGGENDDGRLFAVQRKGEHLSYVCCGSGGGSGKKGLVNLVGGDECGSAVAGVKKTAVAMSLRSDLEGGFLGFVGEEIKRMEDGGAEAENIIAGSFCLLVADGITGGLDGRTAGDGMKRNPEMEEFGEN